MTTEEQEVAEPQCEEYCLDLKSRRVSLTKDGKKRKVEFMEMNADERADYMNGLAALEKTVEKTGKRDYKDIHGRLISRCGKWLDSGDKITVEEVRAWPSTQTDAIFKLCNEVCGLGKKAKDDAKND